MNSHVPEVPVSHHRRSATIADDVDFEIKGHEMQFVEVELDPGESAIAEAGAMNYMHDGIQFETKMGDGTDADQGIMGKLLNVGKRVLTGESIFLTHFTNQGQMRANNTPGQTEITFQTGIA